MAALRRSRRARQPTYWEEFASRGYFFAVDDPAGMLAELAARVPSVPEAPAVGPPVTHLEHVDETTARWARGSRAFTDFRATVQVATVSGRPGLLLTYADVVTVDGVVAEFGALRALREQVGEVLRGLRPGVVEEVVNGSMQPGQE